MKVLILIKAVLLFGVLQGDSIKEDQSGPMVFYGNPATDQPINIGPWTYFYEDLSGDTLPLEVISKKTFAPFADKRNERTSHSKKSLQATWLRFSIRNDHPHDTLKFFFSPGVTEITHVYKANRYMGTTGVYTIVTEERPYRHHLPVSIPPAHEQIYWSRSVILINAPTPVMATLYTPDGAQKLLRSEIAYTTHLLIVMGIIVGCLFFMSLYAFYHYYLGRDSTLLYYALYVSCCFLLAVTHVDIRFGLGWIYPFFNASRFPLSIALAFAFYLLFISKLLGVKARYPQIRPVLDTLFALLLAQQGIALIEFFIKKPVFGSNFYYTYMLVPSALSLLIVIVLIIQSESPIKKYLLAGSLSLVIITLVPTLINFYILDLSYIQNLFLNYLPFWSYLGLTIECFCFALALVYRSRLVEIQNQTLQENYTIQLREELAARTKEIEEKNVELEAQHIRQVEMAFEQKLAETEMTALRSQMNPHFIFNCLNSIKFFAAQNNGTLASEYLTKFSRLIRRVLENSRLPKVTLQNELEALDLYLEMEVMRFNQKLSYEIKVSDDLEPEFVEIPPLLIQPYVENAIWHGLMHKKEGGKVTVHIEQAEIHLLRVTITDNGVGRANAALLKSKSATNHKSFGMRVTSERIQLINQLYQSHTHVHVNDLVNDQGEGCGTEVVLTIPI